MRAQAPRYISGNASKQVVNMRKLQLLALSLGVLIVVLLASKRPQEREEQRPRQQPRQVEQEPEKPPRPTVRDALDSISRQDLERNLGYLASDELEGRMSGKKGNRLAAEFIKKEFEKLGLPTENHKFMIRRMNPGPKNEIGDDFTENVYAWMEGNDPQLKNEVVVVGAHMDHIGYGPSMSRWGGSKIHPGADDNASGTAALLEIAKAFSKMKGQNKRTVVFMAFSAEEMGLKGSLHYVNNPIFPKGAPDLKKHVFMLNMDMVGHLGKGQTMAFDDGSSSPDIGDAIRGLAVKYNFASTITFRGASGSDHAPFYNKKVPVAFLHTGLHKFYHTPNDTVDRINFDGLEQVSRYGFELAWVVCNSAEKPAFDYGSFNEMDYEHDHGQKDVPFEEKPRREDE